MLETGVGVERRRRMKSMEVKARNPHERRRAVAFSYGSRQTDPFWHTALSAAVVRRLVVSWPTPCYRQSAESLVFWTAPPT